MRDNNARNMLLLCFLPFLVSLTLFLVALLAPPGDDVCVQKNILYSPLQAAIQYEWVNYADSMAAGKGYRTLYNTSVSAETDRAWLDLIPGSSRGVFILTFCVYLYRIADWK